jgi:hypothetical protein
MKPLNKANHILNEILISLHVFDIGLEEEFEDGVFYCGLYPLSINDHEFVTTKSFGIHVFQWSDKYQCLKLIVLQYKIDTGTSIIYLKNPNFDGYLNQLGEKIIKSERFISEINPLIAKGLREYSLHYLLKP